METWRCGLRVGQRRRGLRLRRLDSCAVRFDMETPGPLDRLPVEARRLIGMQLMQLSRFVRVRWMR
jgi:hypothetical protein